jgi:hypothetical protein
MEGREMIIVDFVRRFYWAYACIALVSVSMSPPTLAQSAGFAVGETGADTKQPNVTPDISVAAPVRLARFSYIQGDVTWRESDAVSFTPASNNQPLNQSAQITVGAGGRAEIQFDDGGYLRLGSGANVTLQLLFSDSEGEFTELTLSNGLCSLSLKHDRSVYQVDTPLVSVKADGPARVRVGIRDGVEVALREGAAVVEGAKGKITLKGGDYLDLRDETSPFNLRDLPDLDSWDRWNDERDQMLDAAEQSLERHDVPENIALVAGNLDAYGTWSTDADYGQVWRPRTPNVAWRPYFAGHWAWLKPFGWTWCSDEAWGWAPYHYGTWFHSVQGWEWKPGPADQFWSPAVVNLAESNGNIAWCALSPAEVRYPSSMSVGILGQGWTRYFSIGAAGSYYPAGTAAYCVGRAYIAPGSASVRVGSGVSSTTSRTNIANKSAIPILQSPATGSVAKKFVPINARAAAGVTSSTHAAFAGRGAFTPVVAGATYIFIQGHTAPISDRAAVFGPSGVMPPAVQAPANSHGSIDVSNPTVQTVFRSVVPSDPVHSGVPPPQKGSGTTFLGTARQSASGAAEAARSTLNGGRSQAGYRQSGGSAGGNVTSGGAASPPRNNSGGVASGGSVTSGGIVSPPHSAPGPAPAQSGGGGSNSGGGSPPVAHTFGGGSSSGGSAPSGGSPQPTQAPAKSSGGTPVKH